MDELAKVSANAILKDDEKLRSYFGVSNEEREWYYNQQDIFKEIERQVRENTQVRFANISLKISDEFMQAVEEQILMMCMQLT